MVRNANPFTSVFGRAWCKDPKTGIVYRKDALLIAMLAHTHGEDRNGPEAQRLRKIMLDQNLEE